MKKQQWYLVLTDKVCTVTNDIEEFKHLKTVIIKITPDEAASILLLQNPPNLEV